jgi:4-hydroxybenzoate polyprenyltransferase
MPTGIITLKQAKLQTFVLLLVFILGSFLFRLDIYFILFNLLLLLLGIWYSIPPLQFKSRPGLDLLLNMVGYGGLSFFIGWSADTPISKEMIIMALPYFIFMAAMYINTTLIDYEGDRDSGLSTTGVFLGKYVASLSSLMIVLITMIIGYIQGNWIIFSIVGISFPLFVVACLKKDRKNFLLSVQVPGWLFVIFLGLIYPYYFLFIVFLYLLTKFYYKRRFNMDYPRIGEEKQTE